MFLHPVTACHRAILLCAVLATGAQAAGPSATTEITSLTYQLIDIDLNDGIAPSIDFVSIDDTAGSHFGYLNPKGYYEWTNSDVIDTLDSTSLAGSFGTASTFADGASFRASSAVAPGPNSPGMFARTTHSLFFKLSPSTRVNFSAIGALDADLGSVPGSAEATVGLTGTMLSYDLGVPVEYYSFSFYQTAHMDEQSFALSGSLQSSELSLYASVDLYAVANAVVYSGGPTPPVPEPHVYAMLLLGVGVVGAIARRRHV